MNRSLCSDCFSSNFSLPFSFPCLPAAFRGLTAHAGSDTTHTHTHTYTHTHTHTHIRYGIQTNTAGFVYGQAIHASHSLSHTHTHTHTQKYTYLYMIMSHTPAYPVREAILHTH